MFNNIREILSRRNDQSRSPDSLLSRTSDEGVENTASSAEGFLCPYCFIAFPTADALQNHYESSHSNGINEIASEGKGFVCPACKMKQGSEIELQSHYARHHTGPKDEMEIEAMILQVKALEEGKELVKSELQAVQAQYSTLLRENIKLTEERNGLELKAAKQASELADLKYDLDELKSKNLSTESALKLSEEKISKLEVEIQQRPEADDVNVLKQEIVKVQKMMDQLTLQREAEKDTLQKQCNNLQESCLKLQAEKTELEHILKNCPQKDEVQSLQNRVSDLSTSVSKLEKDLVLKEAENKKLQVSLEKYANYDKIKALLEEKVNILEEVQRTSNEKDAVITKLKSELKMVKENIDEMKVGREKLFSKIEEGEGANVAILQLKEENARLQEQFLHQQTLYGQTLHETGLKMDELRSSAKKANSELQVSNEKCKELEKDLTAARNARQELNSLNAAFLKDANSKLESLSTTLAADQVQIQKLLAEMDNKDKSLNEEKLKVENLEKELKKEASLNAKTIEKLQAEKSSFEKMLVELQNTLQLQKDDLLVKEKKLAEAEKKLQQTSDLCRTEESKRAALEVEIRQLQEKNEETSQKLRSMEDVVSNFEVSNAELCNKISSLNEDLLESQMKESELNAALENINEVKSQINEKCLSFEEESKSLRSSVTILQNEKNSLLSELEKMKKSLSDLMENCAAQEREISELKDLHQKEKSNAEKVLKESNIAKEVYLSDKVKMQKQIENLENDCAKQVSQMQETVKALETQCEDAEEKSIATNSALDEMKKLLLQKEFEWEEKETRYIAQVGILTENIQTMREDLLSEQKKRETLEQSLDEVSGLKLELEAKLENANDERTGLLKRCLSSEAECERLQKSTSEMRRKYEDCVAALQELGRENQTLQVENMKHIQRKWADDGEVTHCTACGKLFTVTIRKHHCRNCGNIFCNECSAKNATVASSKKPVRVCDICYNEVTK